jgi:CubicO group peptidase (beta-lactamase class C family)/uncharacterized membrane protein
MSNDSNLLIEGYLSQLRRQLAELPSGELEEFLTEIRTHLSEQSLAEGGDAQKAIARLGDARDLAALYLTEQAVADAVNSRSPSRLLTTALRLSRRGISWALLAVASLIGYAAALSLILTAAMKPFFPSHVGLWWGSGVRAIGSYSGAPDRGQELLGWWIIPSAAVLGIAVFIGTTFGLRRVLRSFRTSYSQRRSSSHGPGGPRSAVMLLLLTFLIGVASNGTVSASTQPWEANDSRQLRESIATILQKENIPGAAVAIIQDRRLVWSAGIGTADIEKHQPVTASTLFRAGSITKSFVALGIMLLVQEGKIDLDRPLREIAPEIWFRNQWQVTHPITIRELLEHTAGLDDSRFNDYASRDESSQRLPLLDVLAKNPRSRIIRWEPGIRYSYSNVGYTICAYLIEKISGQRHEDFINERIFRQLGMSTAALFSSPGITGLANGYDHKVPVPYYYIFHRPAGSLVVSANDLAQLVLFLLNRGAENGNPILSGNLVREMETPRCSLAAARGIRVGYGIGLMNDIRLPIRMFGHDGGLLGFVASYRYEPEFGFGYVVLLNSASPKALRLIEDSLFARLTAGLPLPKSAEQEIDLNVVRPFIGDYEAGAFRPSFAALLVHLTARSRIYLEDGKLWLKHPFAEKERLFPTGPRSFRVSSEPQATIFFTQDDQGRRVLLLGPDYYQPASRLLWSGEIAFLLFWCVALLLGLAVTVFHGYHAARYRTRLRPAELLQIGLALVLLVAFIAIANMTAEGLMTQSWQAVTLWLCGWAFAAFAFVGLIASCWASYGQRRTFAAAVGVLSSATSTCVAVYLWCWHFLGVALWQW